MDLSLQQVLNLRKVQDDWNTSTACYLDLYRKIMKKLYTADLRNLLNGEIKIMDVELNIPQLDPIPTEPEEYTTMLEV
ncbi:uncharacterized protein LOC108154726, partial [Drosophila miranda]|uniref:uncharacterized protein LOC108154726 n=1 Tax=Drosophila miranda TaxID=7229 RepID=UPI00143F88C7